MLVKNDMKHFKSPDFGKIVFERLLYNNLAFFSENVTVSKGCRWAQYLQAFVIKQNCYINPNADYLALIFRACHEHVMNITNIN